ncbi:MAG TPA: AsmA family protein [Candidatus Methylomirabilis sp.]|nr:AsmA family protein [Candidatus Methylomirabilis sp.]
MKRLVRILVVIVVVLIVLVLAVPFLVPVDKFRPTIEEKASQALGRQVELGNLSLSLLSGSLTAEKLSIGDDPKFSKSPFLTAQSLKVGVEIMPLIFSKTLNVTGITIQNPEVTLLHTPSGEWNFSSLGGASARSEQKAAARTATPNAVTPADLSVQQFNLTDGRIILGTTTSTKRGTYDHVNVTASNFSMTSKFPVTVTADLPAGGNFKLDGTAGPIDQSDASLTPLNAKLNLSSLNIASTGFVDAASGLGGLLDLDADVASQNGEAETKGTAKLSKALLVAGGAPAGVPVTVNFNTKYNLQKNAGVLNPSTLSIGSAVAHLNGTYETAGEATQVNLKLDAKDMPAKDLEAFLPALGIHLPTGATLQAGTLNADFTITGPTNKLVIAGDTGLFNGTLAGFDLGSKLSAIASLAGIKSGQNLAIEKMTSNLRIAPTGIEADNFLAVLPALGNLAGAGTIDAKNALDFKMIATLEKESAAATAANPTGTAASVIGGLLGKSGGGAGGCNSGLKVPFQIQGTTADPKFIPDVGGLAAGLFKSQLGCVGDLSATGAKDAGKAPGDAIKDLGNLFKKKKPS